YRLHGNGFTAVLRAQALLNVPRDQFDPGGAVFARAQDRRILQVITWLLRQLAIRPGRGAVVHERAISDDDGGERGGQRHPAPAHPCTCRLTSRRRVSSSRSHTSRTAPRPPAACVMK